LSALSRRDATLHRCIAAALVLLVAVAAACSSGGSGGSGLTGKAWQLTAITTKRPAFQGVVPEADQSKYTIEFKTDGTYGAKADCDSMNGSCTTTACGGLTVQPGTTIRQCPGPLPGNYLLALTKATSYAIANGLLTITEWTRARSSSNEVAG
jgi:heat shock protein HslJ